MTRLSPSLLLALLLPALGACTFGPGGGGASHANAARTAACRARADQVSLIRDPGQVYRADQYASSERDSPFSATGGPGQTSRGLSAEYDRQTILNDCLNATGGEPSGGPTAPAIPR